MLLDDDTVFICGQFEGIQLATHHQDQALLLCRFGPTQSVSLVGIGQNLDRLLVFDLALLKCRLLSGQNVDFGGQPHQTQPIISYISIENQVIQTIAVTELETGSKLEGAHSKDLILIGCNDSVMVYDTLQQEHLFSVRTSTRITTITPARISIGGPSDQLGQSLSRLMFCGGVQKLYVFQVDCGSRLGIGDHLRTSDKLVNFEMSNERTIGEVATCMIVGRFKPFACLIVGLQEGQIRVFTVDLFDQSIQMCHQTLTETAKVNCLCAIETLVQSDGEQEYPELDLSIEAPIDQKLVSDFPSIVGNSLNRGLVGPKSSSKQARMNYFGYGLENGTLGVYRLVAGPSKELGDTVDDQMNRRKVSDKVSIFSERLWRHRAKQAVVALSLFDIDGDGQDELIVGYRNGLVEARSAFTGQLLVKTRCFKAIRGDKLQEQKQHLVGFINWSIDEIDTESKMELRSQPTPSLSPVPRRNILLACSSSGSLVAFRPKQKRPHRALAGYVSDKVSDMLSSESYKNLIQYVNPGEKLPSGFSEQDGEHQQDLQQPLLTGDSDDDDDDDMLDDTKRQPIDSESRQNSELLQQVGMLKKNIQELKLRHRDDYAEFIRRQLSRGAFNQPVMYHDSVPVPDLSNCIKLAHSWTFNGLHKTLTLNFILQPLADLSVSVEMIEISDPNRRLLASGHLIIDPVRVSDGLAKQPTEENIRVPDRSANKVRRDSERQSASGAVSVELVLVNSILIKQRQVLSDGGDRVHSILEESELRVTFFISGSDRTKDQPVAQRSSQMFRCIRERIFVLPKLALFVPRSLFEPATNRGQSSGPMIRKTFILPERSHEMRISNWMQTNSIYSGLGYLVDDLEHTTVQDGAANAQLATRKLSLNSNSTTNESEESEFNNKEDEFVEFDLVDLESFHMSVANNNTPNQCRRFRLRFSTETRHLTLESNDSDLLVEIIQVLVIDLLSLNLSEHALDDRSETDGAEVLLKELKTINENCRQLEESERRIETEIYESAEIIKCLMQQMSVANELQEYEISRELLSEISMMLNVAQNSAHAFNLNNRSRLNLMKKANRLREKVLFLTGGNEQHLGS